MEINLNYQSIKVKSLWKMDRFLEKKAFLSKFLPFFLRLFDFFTLPPSDIMGL